MARELKVEIVGDASSYTRSLRTAERNTSRFNKEISRTTRGIAAGSGAFRTLGRSLAFASGGFIAAASITDLLRSSIEQASEAAVVQKQLAAQFKASGLNLRDYQRQIDETVNSLSNLAGIEDDEVKAAFVLAFRSTKDVQQGLRITAIAADVAKARNMSLAQATLVLTKAYAGNTTALRRLLPNLPKNVSGLQALAFVAKSYAGQARAGTTDQERFNAAFANFQEAIGAGLLPTFNKLLRSASKWLGDSKNQVKVQHDVETVVRTSATAFGLLADAIDIAAKALEGYKLAADKLSGIKGPSLLDIVDKLPGGRGSLLGWLGLMGGGRPGGPAGPVGTRGFRTGPPGLTGPLAPTTVGPLGFNARFARLDLALTKAERTLSRRDDREILVQQAALLRERLTKVKNMKDILRINQQLTGVLQNIQNIDEEQQQKEEDAHQKELDARKKAADKARAHAAKLRAQAAAVKAQLQSALDSAITQMGELFQVFVPDDPAKGILGVIGGGVSAKSLTTKLKAQTDQVVAFNRDLSRLAKRGAPPALIAALSAQGLAGAQNVHALATASGPALNAFLRQYARRQRVAQQIAHADIRAKNVYINGNIRRTATTPTSQRRGRNAGVIDAAMMAGAGSPWS